MDDVSGVFALASLTLWLPWLFGLAINAALLVITATTWRATNSAGWLLLACASATHLLQAIPGAVQNYLIYAHDLANSTSLLSMVGVASALLGWGATALTVVGLALVAAEHRRLQGASRG